MTINGGKGNDTFKQGTNDDGTILGLSEFSIFYGDEGNDKFEDFINTGEPTNEIIIDGGEGDDKIGGASGFVDITIEGQEGNDVVYGGE